MGTSITFSAVNQDLQAAIKDLQSRPDYSRKSSLQQSAKTFNTASQALMVASAQQPLDATQAKQLADELSQQVLPSIEALVNANLKMANMGPLNTRRVLNPETVRAHNNRLNQAQQSTQRLVAQLAAVKDTPEKPDKPDKPDKPVEPSKELDYSAQREALMDSALNGVPLVAIDPNLLPTGTT